MTTVRATYRELDATPIEMPDAKGAWADEARAVLERVAREYRGLISYGDLAEEIQSRSGIRTTVLMHYWIGDVLGRVSQGCHGRGEPLLSALCVQRDGTMGDGYSADIAELYQCDPPVDPDRHAAEERFECYRYFGAVMPADGGSPALTPQVATRRRTAARRAKADARRPACPTCFLTLPSTGQCDNCAP
jgi:hypothetical protein